MLFVISLKKNNNEFIILNGISKSGAKPSEFLVLYK